MMHASSSVSDVSSIGDPDPPRSTNTTTTPYLHGLPYHSRYQEEHALLLAIADVASDFTLTRYVFSGPRPNAAAVKTAFEDVWLAHHSSVSYPTSTLPTSGSFRT